MVASGYNARSLTFCFQTFVTAISMSAIATNGMVQGLYFVTFCPFYMRIHDIVLL